ncbi:MAG: hypothetical protein ABFC24_08140 [Methanoregulaceae archaeon]
MDWRDILPFVAGIVIILFVATILQPAGILPGGSQIPATSGNTSLPPAADTTSPTIPIQIQETTIPTDTKDRPDNNSATIPIQILWTPAPTPVPTLPLPVITPYRIYFNGTPLSYPRLRLPDNMISYGASDVIKDQYRYVAFAYLDEPRGGITQMFTVPYPVWVLNATITSKQPQYAHFRMLLCDASTGEIYQGAEIYYSGTMYKSVPISGKPMYLIISTSYVDRFHISLETNADYIPINSTNTPDTKT